MLFTRVVVPSLLVLSNLACGGSDSTSADAGLLTAPLAIDAAPTVSIVGTRWVEESGNPIALPVCPEWNCLGMTDPALARNERGELLLWFAAGGDESPGGPVLGRATQQQDGTFVVDSLGPARGAVEGAWDVRRETPSIRFDPANQRLVSWYLGYAVSFFDDPAIGQALSTDTTGTAFEDSEAPIYRPVVDGWDANFVSGPTVVEGHDGVWRLYYGGAGTTVGIGLLESTDGETWSPHPNNPVLERDLAGWDQGILEPEVELIGGVYHMWYSGYEEPLDLTSTPISVGLATSVDGVTWERYPENPVLEPSGVSGAWNELRVSSPSVVEADDDGAWILAVHGQSTADAAASVPLGRIGFYRFTPAPEQTSETCSLVPNFLAWIPILSDILNAILCFLVGLSTLRFSRASG